MTPDPITQAREIVSGMTPGPWRSAEYDVAELNTIWSDAPHTLIARTCFAPSSEANAAGIVLATNLLRTLTSEGAEEALARMLWEREKLCSELAGSIISSTGLAIEPFEDCADTTWRPDARAIISHLLAQAIGEGK